MSAEEALFFELPTSAIFRRIPYGGGEHERKEAQQSESPTARHRAGVGLGLSPPPAFGAGEPGIVGQDRADAGHDALVRRAQAVGHAHGLVTAQGHGPHGISRQAAVQTLGVAQGAKGPAELRSRLPAQSKLGVQGRQEGMGIHLPDGRSGFPATGMIGGH